MAHRIIDHCVIYHTRFIIVGVSAFAIVFVGDRGGCDGTGHSGREDLWLGDMSGENRVDSG